MTTARQGRVGFPLSLFMLHRNIVFPTARHRMSMIGVGIADELHLIRDRTSCPLAGFGGRHRGLVDR